MNPRIWCLYITLGTEQDRQHFVKQGKSEGFESCDRPGNLTQNGFNHRFFSLCDLEIWWMTLKNNRAPLLCYIKLCASFQSHQWIQNGVTVRKRSIWVKIEDFLSCVTLKFDGWPWKTIGHLCYVASSFLHHFIAIGELKLELQSGNAKLGYDLWPWPLTSDIDLLHGHHFCHWW